MLLYLSKGFGRPNVFQNRFRQISTQANESLRRSYLYVPASADRMLEKSLASNSDIIIYDLEDSISPSPSDKASARFRLQNFFTHANLPDPERIAVRINDISTAYFQQDISQILRYPNVRTLVLPKIHSAQDLHHVSKELYTSSRSSPRDSSIRLVASIESTKSLWNIGSIAGWKSEYGSELGGTLNALLFAAEDYCADSSIIRSPSRRELLYTRSQIVIAAKAFGLDAIDMVCVNYKDHECLEDECKDGRQLGFNGKQAIHPTQVEVIQSTFVPTSEEVLRAAKIIHQMGVAHASQKGAVGLEGEMIDAPMLKQAVKTIQIAKAAGLSIPRVGQGH